MAEVTLRSSEAGKGIADDAAEQSSTILDVRQLLAEAEMSIDTRDYVRAEAALTQVLSSFPYNVDALNNLAVLNILVGKPDEATSLLEKVKSIDPGNKIANDNLLVLNNRKPPVVTSARDMSHPDGHHSTSEEELLEYKQSVDLITSMEDFRLPTEMPEHIIQNGFLAFGNWYTRYTLNGRRYGGNNPYVNDPRIRDFLSWYTRGGRILELGSFEASHTIRLIQSPRIDFVLGVEGKDYLVQRSRLIKTLTASEKMDFVKCDLESEDLSTFGRFDAAFCAGVLFLLSRPWHMIEKVAAVTDNLFISTHYARTARESVEGFEGEYHQNGSFSDPLSGLSDRSFWLTFESLAKALQKNGFQIINVQHFNDWGGYPMVDIFCSKTNPVQIDPPNIP